MGEKISRQHRLLAMAWWLLIAFSQVYSDHQEEKAEQKDLENLSFGLEKLGQRTGWLPKRLGSFQNEVGLVKGRRLMRISESGQTGSTVSFRICIRPLCSHLGSWFLWFIIRAQQARLSHVIIAVIWGWGYLLFLFAWHHPYDTGFESVWNISAIGSWKPPSRFWREAQRTCSICCKIAQDPLSRLARLA